MKNLYSKWLIIALIIAPGILYATPCVAQDEKKNEVSLADMSIFELLNVEVTTTNKHGEKLLDAAAAVYIITGDDLRRMGASSIAEALRLVPGVQVGRVTSSKWSIGARGFCDVFSNKLLVLMDGRSVYSPLFSGVLWDVADTMLEDIDRIEVIRGPGAALWGANAVNGVVNIITKSAVQTDGKYLVYGFGGDLTKLQGLRIGGPVGKNSHLRVYAKGMAYDNLRNITNQECSDSWDQDRSGFRFDYNPDENASLTVMGDAYNASAWSDYSIGEVTTPPFKSSLISNTNSSGSNMLVKWSKAGEQNNKSTLQFYYDNAKIQDPVMFGEDRETYDFDYQRETHPSGGTVFIWGLGYRHSISDTTNGQIVTFKYRQVTDNLYSFFFQNDQKIVPDKLRFILGAKLERNDYTKYEFQPNARLAWTPSSNMTLWGAVSKAVRTPSIADFYSIYNIIAPPDEFGRARIYTIFSNPNMQSEKLTAYELGCRFKPSQRVLIDVAAFMNFYDDLRSLEPGAPYIENTYSSGWQEHLHYPLYVSNNFKSNSRGLELAADYVPSKRWRIRFGASMMNLWLDRSNTFDVKGSNLEKTYPKKQYSIASFWDISSNLTLDAMLYAVGSSEMPSLGKENLLIPAYNRLDFRLAYKDKSDTEWALGAKNFAGKSHIEGGSIYGEQQSYIGQSFYMTAKKTF
ncbi:MAG: TonB-dependent receptor [Armatimonadetes bacterium]|nr:TonB-dependent receptor [Armatimonadota bacterium]